jgi:lactate dehydrogenase-like 2-hydroxyacid dehydrogenase
MVRPRVVVTRRWPKAVEDMLAERYNAIFNMCDTPMSAAELRAAISGADAVLPTVTDKISADVFESEKPQARILANFGVGFSHIDVNAATARGIRITNTPDVLSECTADLAMTLMLMLARRAREGEREVRDGAWTGWRPTHLLGAKVSGKTLGIVGFGRIGQAVARRAHHGFGMRIVVFNRSAVDPDVLKLYDAVQVSSIDDLLPLCDFVSLHCPGGEANRHLIDSRRLNLMKPSAFLINTARGEVVDEKALAQALCFETIGGAGLDVYDGEPRLNPDLLGCPNTVLLPHLGSATTETREAMGFRVLENLDDFFSGRAPRDLVA